MKYKLYITIISGIHSNLYKISAKGIYGLINIGKLNIEERKSSKI